MSLYIPTKAYEIKSRGASCGESHIISKDLVEEGLELVQTGLSKTLSKPGLYNEK